MLCFEIWKKDITDKNDENDENVRKKQFVGITGDNLDTKNIDEIFTFEDNDIVPGRTYEYTVIPYDCSLHPADTQAHYTAQVTVPDKNQFVAMTDIMLNGKTSGSENLNPNKELKITLGYVPENTTYDFSCLNWSYDLPHDVQLVDDPAFPGDPTRKILKAGPTAHGTATISVSAGGGNGVQQQAYGRGEGGAYLIGPVVNASLKVNITGASATPPPPTGAKLNKDSVEIAVGKTEQLTVEIEPVGAAPDEVFTWESDNEDVATVDPATGLVTAVATGEADITAFIESADEDLRKAKATCKVKVVDSVPITDFKITSWAESEQECPILYSGTEQRKRMTIDPIPSTAEYDPDDVTWEVIDAKNVTNTMGGNDPETLKKYEEYVKEYPNLYVACFGPDLIGGSEYNKDELIGISAVSATVTIQASMEINGEIKTKNMDVKVDLNDKPQLPETVRSMVMSVPEKTVQKGNSFDLSFDYQPYRVKDRRPDGIENVRWTSSDESIATVECNGTADGGDEQLEEFTNATVTASGTKSGTCTITANWAGKRASCVVTVEKGEVELTDAKFQIKGKDQGSDMKMELTEGDTYQLMLYPDPIDATGLTPTKWSSNSTGVATVDESTGYVTALTPGEADITGTIKQTKNDGTTVEKTGTCHLTVKEKIIPLTGVAISENTCELKVGESAAVKLSLRPMAANDGFENASWESSNDGVATVEAADSEDFTANIKAVGAGTCEITGTLGGHEMKCTVAVEEVKKPITLSLYKDDKPVANDTVEMSGTNDIIWLECRADGDNSFDRSELYWNSSDTTVAAVLADGTIQAVGSGTVEITATATKHENATVKCTVNVPEGEVEAPTMRPTTEPTIEPTIEPTTEPTTEPTIEPTTEPTKAPESTPVPGRYSISGTVTGFDGSATITLFPTFSTIQIKDGKYKFTNVRPGFYNLIVNSGNKIVTKLVIVKDKDVTVDVDMKKTFGSEVKKEGGEWGNVIVGGLDKLSETENITVTIDNGDEDAKTAIKEKGGEKAYTYKFADISVQGGSGPITDLKSGALDIYIPFTGNSENLTVFRYHDGDEVTQLPHGEKDTDEWFTAESGYVHIHASKFSTYALAAKNHNLTVNVTFPNEVKDAPADYTNMEVKISSTKLSTPITVRLGKGDDAADDVITPEYTPASGSDCASYSFKQEGLAEGWYALSFSGGGYRTFTHSVYLNDDKKVTVWNNAMAGKQTVIEGSGEERSQFDVTFLAGDIIMSKKIDLYDLSAVVSYFGKNNIKPDNTYDSEYAKYDLNRDGRIDSRDIAMVLVSWGK